MNTTFLARLAAILWAWIIWTLSLSPFRSEESKSRLLQVIERMSGLVISAEVAGTVNTLIRKGAHVVEYCIFTIFLYFALRTSSPSSCGWNRAAAGRALAVASLFAITDELHQVFVPGRGASAGDVVIDCVGAVFSILILYRLYK